MRDTIEKVKEPTTRRELMLLSKQYERLADDLERAAPARARRSG